MNTILEYKIKDEYLFEEQTKLDEIRSVEEFANAIANGDILLPVHYHNKIIGKVQWTGNLITMDLDLDNIISGRGLLKLENHIILTAIWASGIAEAHVVTKPEAVSTIAQYKQYHLFDELDLREYLMEVF